MIPALVVPAVATTPMASFPRGWWASVAARPSPVIRWSSHGTGSASTPSIASAFPTDEWASSLMAMRGRSGALPPRRWEAVSLATINADRLPAEPPETKHPPASGGSPARSERIRRAWFSAPTAPAASIHDVPCNDEQATTMSKSSAALVGAAGMNERKRGLSQEITAVARCCSKISMTLSGLDPLLLISPSKLASSAETWAPPKSSGTGSSASRHRQ